MPDSAAPLRGRRILVVEDEYFIAAHLVDELRDGGAEVIGPFATVAESLATLASKPIVDGAVLDVELGTALVWPVADTLLAQHTPVVFTTSYPSNRFPSRFLHLPRCGKLPRRGDILRYLFGQTNSTAGVAA